jgi:hypothetical protein
VVRRRGSESWCSRHEWPGHLCELRGRR